jgi:lysine-N-methylase
LRGTLLRQTTIFVAEYGERFRCIGPACEDSCCIGWSVPVDGESLGRYRGLPPSDLRVLMDSEIVPADAGSEHGLAKAAASMRLRATRECPFLRDDRLCRIQAELGEGWLCRTCAEFPRSIHRIDGVEEMPLTLACPEAARLVLLNPRLLGPATGRRVVTWDDAALVRSGLQSAFWPVREFVVSLIRKRSYPLWQRLFLLGIFCRRLAAIDQGRDPRAFAAFLQDFSSAIAAGKLRLAIESIAPNLTLQLELVLSLIPLRGQAGAPGSNLESCLHAFAEAIGHRPDASADSQTAAYSRAFHRCFEPFFRARPYLLENYLLNEIFRTVFPFGPALFTPEASPDFERAFASLVIPFALIKGLLIGVAGYHGKRFSATEAVATIQTASRYFQHSGRFGENALSLLANRGLNNANGFTALLRN